MTHPPKKKPKLKQYFMPTEQLAAYRRELRIYENKTDKNAKDTKIKKAFYPFLITVMKIKRILVGQKLKILADKSIRDNTPKIFACTHIGRYDIEIIAEALKEQAYIFFGDPDLLYKTIEGWLLESNGVIFVDLYTKEDRTTAKETAVKILNRGANLLIYPEGAINVTQNQIVMPIYSGAVQMALETGAQIIPIGLEQYGKRFVVNIGENICYDNNKNTDIKVLTNELRDTLATLRYEIWENEPMCKRDSLPANCGKTYLTELLSESGGFYDFDMIERTKYKDKNIVTAEEVFNFSIK